LRNYGYSIIGEPLVYKYGKRFNNITCTACISQKEIEALRFFYKGGTTTEYFEDYFDELVKEMKLKYPEKHLLFIMDNLWAHKSTYIMRIMQDLQLEMLLTPSNTPEFSPIENMFGMVKVRLKD